MASFVIVKGHVIVYGNFSFKEAVELEALDNFSVENTMKSLNINLSSG
jgi:hypothetical protein